MKKFLAGCGCLTILLVVAVLAGGYWFIYRPVSDMISVGREAVAEFEAMGELDEEVENDEPFEEPKDGLLTEEQVTRFAAVQRAIVTSAEERGETVEEQYQAMHELGDYQQGERPRIRELAAAFRDLAELAHAVKRDQVDALNDQAFSVAEYQWVKTRFYEAYGVGIIAVNPGAIPDFDSVRQGFQNGDLDIDFDSIAGGVRELQAEAPAENVALITPYRTEIADWIPHASLGL